jgi:hypothetical protein
MIGLNYLAIGVAAVAAFVAAGRVLRRLRRGAREVQQCASLA